MFNTEPLDLIVLDIMMPHMDGLRRARRIRQTSTVPIIVLTALGEESDKVRALDQEADDCLTIAVRRGGTAGAGALNAAAQQLVCGRCRA